MAVSGPDNISLAEFQWELNINSYIALVSLTILFYDYILTADEEIRTYWGTRITWAGVLFYLNRYVSMAGNTVPIVVGSFWASDSPNKVQACRALQTYHQYFAIVAQIFVAALLIMRTYALYERSRRILIFTTTVASTAAVVGAYILFSGKSSSKELSAVFVPVGCASGVDTYQSRRFGFAWMGMLVFDFVIFSLTAAKALAFSREQRGGLFMLLVRDGSLYFLVMVGSNCGNILSFFYAGPYTRGVATTFTNVISSVMISRLMLNLRSHGGSRRGKSLRTGESTTLYTDTSAPITTVDPYYPSVGGYTDVFAGSVGESEMIDDNDIPLEEVRRYRRGEP
ncbi:hypothetical protein C8R47DRAFT_1131504 [Mycena vitilis]|nr:hypothetical protein C8R47DRAFT_1131504 [Mycena vitilis]